MSRTIDSAAMGLEDLRRLRRELQLEDDAVSYARRIAQARIDLVAAARQRRVSGTEFDLGHELTGILSNHLGDESNRPPRSVDIAPDPIMDELDSTCSALGFSRLDSLDMDELDRLHATLVDFEQRLSENRRDRYHLLDELSTELIRRYREGLPEGLDASAP